MSFITPRHWRGLSTLFLCNSFYVKVSILLNVRTAPAVEVLSVHQTHDELGGLGGRIQCGEAPEDEASSTCVLRSGSACQPMCSVPNILVAAQHGAQERSLWRKGTSGL